jgi:hypothetical protein
MLQVIGAVGFMDQRLDIPSDADPQWASMIENCWDRYAYSFVPTKWVSLFVII